jgi:hypothetical protein
VIAPPGYPGKTVDGRVLEHKLVMEQKIGRLLTDKEIVHHKDTNRQNNAIENHELRTRKAHPPGGEYTEKFVENSLDALRHNDPDAYARLMARLQMN